MRPRVGQSDVFNSSDIPTPGQGYIDCPFPQAVGSESSWACERSSQSANYVGATAESVFFRDGNGTKLPMPSPSEPITGM